MGSPIDRAEPALEALRRVRSRVADRLAAAVGVGGRVDLARLDERQVPIYEFALFAADVAAAEQAVAHARRAGASGLSRRLAELAVGEAAQSLAVRIASRPADFDLAAGDLESGADLAAFVAEVTSGQRYLDVAERLDDLGRREELGLADDHLLVRETFREYVDAEVSPRAEAIHRQDLLVPEDLIRTLSEMGCFGLSIPAAYGGVADRPDYLGMVVVTEELSRGSLGAAGSLMTRPEILVKALLRGGTEEQRRRWLPPIAAGQQLVAISVTEPDYGSDVAGIRLAARRVEDGWVLSGAKLWCTFAGRAELLMVLARTDPDLRKGHRGLSAFVVEKPAFDGHTFHHEQPGGGRLVGRAIPTLGYRGMHSFELQLEDYRVPADNLIGGEPGLGQGFYLQMAGFAAGRLQTAGRALGLMQAAYEAALSYARQRVVFDRPLFAYPLTRHKVARMAVLLHAGRQFTYHAARLMDEGGGDLEASMAKLFTGRAAEWVTREAQQIHGGMGYAEESAVSRYFVDARVLPIFEGAEEVLALRLIARALLDDALRVGGAAPA